MATTYAELKQEIEDWCDNRNSNFIAIIPTLIQDAESWFRRHLHTREMECLITTPIAPAGVTEEQLGIYDLPADWGGHKALWKDEDTLSILYWRRIPDLSDTNTTNWLLDKYPDVYRYASLAAAEGYLKNDPRLPLWASAAVQGLQEIAEHDEHDRFSGGPLQSRRERWWTGVSRYSGRYEYLPPFDFHDLTVAKESLYDGTRYFTVDQSFIRIWPKPAMPTT